jgi:integrase
MAANLNGFVKQTRHGTWMACWRDDDGRQRTKTHPTKQDARVHLLEVQTSVLAGKYVDPRAGKETVAEYAKYWLAHHHARASTQQSYTGMLNRYVIPILGKVKLADLDYDRLTRWVNELKTHEHYLTGKPISSTTVAGAHRVLKAMLTTAVKTRRISHNPAIGIPLPPKGKVDWKILKRSELELLIQYMPTIQTKTLVLAAGMTGMRWSELAGLTWEHVDLSSGEVRVRQTLVEAGGKMIYGQPKSLSSFREIPLPHRLVVELTDLWRERASDQALVFLSTKGKPMRRSNFQANFWTPALTATGLTGTRIHDLRHSCATWLIESGVDIVTVKDWLGHDSIVTTQLYAHSSAARKRAALTLTFGDDA